MPYFAIESTEIDGFCGLAVTVGWIAEQKSFQIAVTIGTYTVALGFDFDF